MSSEEEFVVLARPTYPDWRIELVNGSVTFVIVESATHEERHTLTAREVIDALRYIAKMAEDPTPPERPGCP